ncbi:MAG: hybrid sensor histidine kinase/response regulator [Verrucomicrobiae bacterium]|nr:hybrid sensor histidine kinase/response regulator [Verrucomicrobiae bacterium]
MIRPPTAPPTTAPAPPARILIVDDQPANLQVLGGILGLQGYDVVLADNGPTALKRLSLRPPDLVLLDVIMPGMDGFDVCRCIREQPAFTDLPVIFLSAADDKDLTVRALESGAVDYVTKPFNQAELVSRVRTHVALKAARDRLRQLAEDKDELLGVLAHDLKGALGCILMSSQLLVERAEADPKLHRLSHNILETADRTLAFVELFLSNTAVEHALALEPAAVRFGELAAEVVREQTATARFKQLKLRLEPPVSDPVVLADRVALRQVLDNLIGNAVKFSPPGRSIWVTFATDAGHAECRIRDEGPGFTPEDRTRMFRRYSRLSARPTGNEPSTGLGLSIVKKLMRSLGGELRCDSEAGRGATFTVRLARALPGTAKEPQPC